MAGSINLSSLIYQQAISQGVPPSIALAVAQKESSISQWDQNGNLVTGSSGEVGVFQIMPATANMLGVDPTDVNENIQGGVSFLASLFQKYGNWTAALSAYNSGSPTRSTAYANSVLAIAANSDSSDPSTQPVGSNLIPTLSAGINGGDVIPQIPAGGAGILTLGLIALGIGVAWWIVD